MPIVDLEILGSAHRVACDDGEENKLKAIAESLNDKLRRLSTMSPNATDIKLLVVNSLRMESEIQELKNSIQKTKYSEKDQDETVAKTLDAVTEYVVNLAKKLEKI